MDTPVGSRRSASTAARERTVTTADAASGQGFNFWQELISDTFVPLTAAPTTDRPFRGRIIHRVVGQIELTAVRASGQHVRRTPRLIARSDEEYLLASIQVSGCGEINQSGRSAFLRPGAMAFYDSSRPYDLHFPDLFEQLVVQVPRTCLPAAAVERSTGIALDAGSSGRLVADFFRGLARQAAADPVGAAALAPHAVGLLNSALSLAIDPDQTRRPASSDRERVRAFLTAHFAEPGLDADTVAEGCHLSRRTLFRLFEHEPEGLSTALRRLRVTEAQRVLRAEPRLPLATVAARCGFGGEAQMHRAFSALTVTTAAAYRRAVSG